MNKPINELQQSKKELSPELINFLKDMHESSLKNIQDLKQQIADAELELSNRRNRGENI